jgi:EthD domain
MIKLIFCLRRVAQLSRDEFQEYWRTKHRPLVVERAKLLRFKSYSQLHTVDIRQLSGLASVRGSPDPYDGIAEACFETIDDLLVTRRDPQAARAAQELVADEKQFIDHSRSPIFFVQQDIVIDA